MDVTVLSAEDVARLLPMGDCMQVMRAALGSLARGKALVPLRMVMRMRDASGFLGLMPGHIGPDDGRAGALGMKAVSVFPGNARRGIDTHQGAVLLFEEDTGRLSALMDGATITAIRTAAVSGVATDLLAGRFGVSIEAVPTAEAAVREADVVATVTASPQPVLQRPWVKDGAHINAVGSSIPTTREIDTATMAAVRLFVDRRESALNEAGDLLIPMREGAFTADHIQAELGEVIIGNDLGRQSPVELTLFKSLGLAAEDVASASFILKRARARGMGQTVRM